MKNIVDSSNKMRCFWTNLVQVEKGDKGIVVVEGCRDYFQTFDEGTYLIEYQKNDQFARTSYTKISKSFAEKLKTMEIDDAVEAMARYIFA